MREELDRARLGEPWVQVTPGRQRGVRTLEVFLPYGRGPTSGVVEVLLPESRIAAQVRRASRLLDVGAAAVLALSAVALLLLRRRLRLREHRATHDVLTGLLNRAGLAAAMRAPVASASAERGRVAALLMLDLDGFKSVNDTLGHPAGDALLIQVGQALRDSCRTGDLIARLGGDEFAVLVSGLPDASTAQAIASVLLSRVREGSYVVHGIELTVDASIGLALIPAHGRDVDRLLQRAAVAMFQAKRSRAGTTTYDEVRDPHDVAQLGLLAELRRAIRGGELVLHYQPQAWLASGDVAGVEALVRWQHPTKGLLPPSAFVGMAENTGLMRPMTDWVLDAAVHQAARWRDQGMPLSVAVNISPHSLLDGDLPATVLDTLAARGLPAGQLELEITETAIMTDPDRAVQVLQHLHAMGVRVAIDDFGTGYTSLSYLKQLPVQTLKIDRAFISDLLEDSKDEAITESIIALGHKLGLCVLAEGVETADIWQRLQDLNCDQVQGYHLARPMPADDIAGWLQARMAQDPADRGALRTRITRP
jgi:diguanylate cyclase (GGDEF)-like protein